MATAEIQFDYGQILSLVKQLPLSDRKRLLDDALGEPDKNSWEYLFSLVEPNQDITDEEILEECDIVREQLYNERIKNRH